MINWILNIANSQAEKIANVVGVPAEDIRGAIEQGRKLLPEIKNLDDGVGVLRRMGVNSEFVDDMYDKYSRYADKIPGLSKNTLDDYYGTIKRGLSSTSTAPRQQTRQKRPSNGGFDKTKYKKL